MSQQPINTDTIQITPEILSLVAEIDEFKGAWRALGTLAPERLSALRRVATIESIGSSTRIEGSKLSDRDVEKLLANLEIKSFATRDEQEVAGYAEAMDLIFRAWDEVAITENHIKQLHRDLWSIARRMLGIAATTRPHQIALQHLTGMANRLALSLRQQLHSTRPVSWVNWSHG
jgi:Fic family protein